MSSRVQVEIFIVALSMLLLLQNSSCLLPRNVKIRDTDFILTKSEEPLVMVGPNIVVKGPPHLPFVRGDTICNDLVNDDCTFTGSCISCDTFNQADVDHIKSMGWNTIRLGVAWAGAQTKDEDALDPQFLEMLHSVLDLTDENDIHVILDNHGDQVGSAGCGNGVPMWFQQKAAPDLIGKRLETHFPYNLVYPIENLGGYAYCGDNETMWANHAGDPNYNLLNECCQQMNGGNPPELGLTSISQQTMDYLVFEGPGRDDFVRYWRLMAEAVKDHPSAFAAELMNEPISIRRTKMFDTWKACAEAINEVIPDMSVAISDVGQGVVIPSWVVEHGGSGILIEKDTLEWIKSSQNLFYAFHYYGYPTGAEGELKNVLALRDDWNVPAFNTEFMSCDSWNACAEANISHTYWHYSSYCTTGPAFGNRKVPDDTFGACILGWAAGDSSKTC